MKTILNSLALIPQGESVLHVLTVEKDPKKQAQKREIQVQIFQPEANLEKRVISLPRFCKIPPIKSVKNLNLPQDYNMTYVGRYGEIWSTSTGLSAIIRRKDSKVTFYGDDSCSKIHDYIVEAAHRGLSLVQATDIICNELTR